MRHNEAISKVEQLMPEIQRTSDPEGVLLKFARQENLSAAQLEKLGQIYNTAKTLAYMDKAACRGGTFKILEIPDMLKKYSSIEVPEAQRKAVDPALAEWIEDTHQQKAAAFAGKPGLAEWFEPAEEPYDPLRDGHFPDLKKIARLQSIPAPIPGPSCTIMVNHTTRKEAALRVTALERDIESTGQVIYEQGQVFIEKAAELKGQLQFGIPFSEVEEDALDLLGAGITEAVEKIVEKVANERFKVARMAPNKKRRRIALDRHGLVPTVKAASDAWQLRQKAINYRAHLRDQLKTAAAAAADLQTAPEGVALPAWAERTQALAGGGAPPGDSGRAAPREPRHANNPQTAPEDTSRQGRSAPAAAPAAGDGGGSAGGSRKDPDTALAGIGRGLKRVGDGMHAAAPSWLSEENLSRVFKQTKHHKQIAADEALDDGQFETTVAQLAIGDPILAKADPNRVASLANTIRAASPDSARDVNVMRFLLREAIAYDGMPSHTHKDLVTTQELHSRGKQHEVDMNKERYAIT